MGERPTPGSTRREGVSVITTTLADGALWGLALPCPRFRPRAVSGTDAFGRRQREVVAVMEIGHPAEVLEAVGRLRAAREGPDQSDAFFSLASALLRRAHDIDRTTAHELLNVPDAELSRLALAVVSAVTTPVAEPPPGPTEDVNS